MASLPYMPFFVAEYLLDAGHLSEEEHGAYLRLLMMAWASPECRLPNDDAWLARRLSKPIETIARLYRPILAEFWITDGNWLFQKRQRAEWQRARDKASKQSDNAKSRWHKGKDTCGGNADAMPPQSHPHRKKESPTDVGPKKEPEPPAEPVAVAPAALPPSPTPPSKAKPVKTSRGTRLPSDWTPGPDGIAYAVAVGLTEAQAEDQAERMRLWAKNAQGSKGVKLDWSAAWQGWCRRAADEIARLPLPRGQPPPLHERGSIMQSHYNTSRRGSSSNILFGDDDDEEVERSALPSVPLYS